jgi:DNA repair protein RecN (Recombination protein N)
MLQELSIRNFVLIDEARVLFSPGLTLITGETGAGKSVLIGALGQLAGDRADLDLIRSDRQQAEIEGVFHDVPPALARTLQEEFGVAGEDGLLILKRQLSRDGRGRCFANGSSITLSTLRTIGNALVDIHGQHEHQSLLDVHNHLDILDAYGKLGRLTDAYRQAYDAYAQTQGELRAQEELERTGRERRDLYEFQLRELRNARLAPGEDERVEGDLRRLENAERLAGIVNNLVDLVTEADQSLLTGVGQAGRLLAELARIDPAAATWEETGTAVQAQLNELARALQEYRERLEFEPQQLEQLQSRREELHLIKKKYGGSIESAAAFLTDLESRNESYEQAGEKIGALKKELQILGAGLTKAAQSLSAARQKAGQGLAREVERGLAEVGMQGARFAVDCRHQTALPDAMAIGPEQSQAFTSGIDLVEFYVATNPGEKPLPLAKIASGGEVSRIMLVLKSILLERHAVPTMVFDEIDVGISGRMAQVVGEKLAAIAARRQVLCITHLPQIASQAAAHLVVRKEQSKERTTITIDPVDRTERVEEVARLLGGKDVTAASRKNAQELLEINSQHEFLKPKSETNSKQTKSQ